MIECAADSVQKRSVCPPREVFPLEGKVSRLCDLDSEVEGFLFRVKWILLEEIPEESPGVFCVLE